jgi:ribosomal protein L29
MAVIPIKELRQKSEKELLTLLNEEKEKLRKLRFQNSEGKLRRNHLFSQKRRTIAQILTIIKK